MARPQQPELARSAKTDLDPDHVETGLQGQKKPSAGGATGPIPRDNQPGHHPAEEQDKPDLDAFAARLGADPKAPTATSARKPGRSKATSAKTTPTKTTPTKTTPAKATPTKATPTKTTPAKATPTKTTPTKTTPTKGASRPATTGEKKTPAPPPKIEATPAKRPAAAPTSRPETAPGREDAVHFSVPQPQPEGTRESPIVGLMLMPLRETVKWLEQVERKLTERLTGAGARESARR